jgi:hypothetical protein
MLPIKKIYIDTRPSTADSKSTSDFKISLPNNITLPSNTAFYITDITVPVVWYTVEAGRNDTIYFRINGIKVPLMHHFKPHFLRETAARLHLVKLCVMW